MKLTTSTNPNPATLRNPRPPQKPDLFGGTLISAGLTLAAITAPTLGGVINVPGDEPTIAAALSVAVDGDEIVLAPGIYNYGYATGTPANAAIFESRFDGKAITLRSIDPSDPAIVAATVLNGYDDDAGSQAYGLQFGLGDGDVLSGLTITEFNVSPPASNRDFLIVMDGGSSLINCVLSGNSALGSQVKMNATSGTSVIRGCAISGGWRHIFALGPAAVVIEDCSFFRGGTGGVIVDGCALTLNRCDFDRVYSYVIFVTYAPAIFPDTFGGVLKIMDLADTSPGANVFTNLVFRNTNGTFANDPKYFQRGLVIDIEPTVTGLSESIVFANCTIVGTNTYDDNALDVFGAANGGSFVNCIIRDNRLASSGPTNGALATFDPVNTGPVLFSNVDDTLPPGSANNIDADPLFADVQVVGYLDVHLTAGSPSIDAGNSYQAPGLYDLEGNARLHDDPATPNTGIGIGGLWVDHGAYEFGSSAFGPPETTGACCLTGGICLEVAEADCIAVGGTYEGDGTDCGMVVCPAACPADISGDSLINVTDLLMLLAAWGVCP